MNTKIKVVALATLIITLGASAKAEGFLRPSILFVSPGMAGASDATGESLAFGTRFGAQAEHELSIEGNWVQWDEKTSYAGFAVSGSLKYAPYLANYRYYFGQKDSPVRLYFGPSVGIAITKVSVTATGPGVNVAAGGSTTSAAYGGTAGLVIRLAEKVDLDVGYRYLYVKGSNVSVAGVTAQLDDAKANVLYAGVSFRF